MKQLRKWSRILHRDIGFFFVGASIVFGISGIALNHIKDWNPNYKVTVERKTTNLNLSKTNINKKIVLQLLAEIDAKDDFKSYNFVEQGTILRIYLSGRSSVTVKPSTGEVIAEYVKKRPIFYQVNFLHYNPNKWWMWFSDIFAGSLIFLALSSIFIVRGKKGAWGRGGVYIILGIIIPILFLIFS